MRDIDETRSAAATQWQGDEDETDDAETSLPGQEDPPPQNPSGGT